MSDESRSSSVSIVSDYRLGDLSPTPAEAKDFSPSLCVHTNSETHPASYPIVTEGPFTAVEAGRSVTLTTRPHLGQEIAAAIRPFPLSACLTCSRTAYLTYLMAATRDLMVVQAGNKRQLLWGSSL
jgi:hypothetical protein